MTVSVAFSLGEEEFRRLGKLADDALDLAASIPEKDERIARAIDRVRVSVETGRNSGGQVVHGLLDGGEARIDAPLLRSSFFDRLLEIRDDLLKLFRNHFGSSGPGDDAATVALNEKDVES